MSYVTLYNRKPCCCFGFLGMSLCNTYEKTWCTMMRHAAAAAAEAVVIKCKVLRKNKATGVWQSTRLKNHACFKGGSKTYDGIRTRAHTFWHMNVKHHVLLSKDTAKVVLNTHRTAARVLKVQATTWIFTKNTARHECAH